MVGMVRFSIEKVFDLPARGGLLALGTVLEDVIPTGMVLQDETTGARTTVLGLEFHSPPGRTTLVLERTDPSPVIEGRVLTSPT
jgi:hypothetical protein